MNAAGHNAAFTPYEFLCELFGYPVPTTNDCGYAGRYEHEDVSRLHGYGPRPGEGPCDYPGFCPVLLKQGSCPFYTLVDSKIATR